MKLTSHPNLMPRLRVGGAVPLLPPYAFIVWERETTFFFFSVQRELSQPGTFMACIHKTQGSHLSGDKILAEPFPAFSQLMHPYACTIYKRQLSLQFIIH
jgi:hypothetical protein